MVTMQCNLLLPIYMPTHEKKFKLVLIYEISSERSGEVKICIHYNVEPLLLSPSKISSARRGTVNHN
jgi:hypothetical protein